jgi:hypothetical protein
MGVIFRSSEITRPGVGTIRGLGCILTGRNLTTKTSMNTGWDYLDLPISNPRRFSGLAKPQAADNPVPNPLKPSTQSNFRC